MASLKDDKKAWVTIYPAYLDSTKTVAAGRKVTKEIAVARPTLAEIMTCAKRLGLLCIEEPNKAYSRDPVMEVGRVKVQLKINESPVNPEVPSRTYNYLLNSFSSC